jgi:outer membrane lipoprotein SlyB
METPTNKPRQALLWIAGSALIVCCVAGTAAFMGWLPASMGGTSNSVMPDTPAANSPKPAAAKRHTSPVQAPAIAKCTECGVIESTREIDTRGEGTGLGAVGGAVVGGVLGHQVGSGRGNDVATVVGAVGGAFAGNQIEKRVKSTKSYEITIRLDDGSRRVMTEANPPTWRAGDKVKVIDGVIRSNA